MQPANKKARTECQGNCAFGDEDFLGLTRCLAYDGSRCTCARCPNFDVCHTWAPTVLFETCRGKCVTCDVFFGCVLQFRDPPPEEDCCVCAGTERQVKFPKCQHWCCADCMRNIMLGDCTRYQLDPCRFGCPPCPNRCKNPARGRQCGCEEYDAVKDEWESSHPLEYQHYADAEEAVINEGESASSAFESGRCPICRQRQCREYGPH